MAKHLSEDEIKFIMSVESSQAQQEIHKLTKETKELNRTNQERRNVMRSLEAQGKKDTEYYRNLEAEIKSTNETIKKNKQLVTELEKKLDVTSLTMAQLRAKAKDLRTQLDHTAKSANPEEYAKLEEELKKVNNRMDELRGTGEYAKKEISGFERTMSMAKTAAKGFVAVQLLSYLKSVGTNAYNTRKEFARYEAVLKNATGSGKEASNVMRTLQTLAADTPASVAEWTEAYIKLINRGIKPTTSELTALGDIATSQGKDLDQFIEALLDAMTGENERLKEFGITAQKNGETTAFSFKGVTTEVKNNDQAIKDYIISLGQLQGVQGSMATQMKELGGLESNLGDQMDNIYNKIGKKLEPAIKSFMGTLGSLLGSLSSSLDTNAEKFDIQMDKVVSLETDLVPLLDRYDELKTKTNLSAQEQEEMNTLISRISQIIPAAITGFNSYGQAISVSTDYAREWIKTEKARLAYLNRSQIEQAQTDKKAIEEKLALIDKQEEISKRLYGTDEKGNAKSIAVYTGARGFGSNAESINYRRASAQEQSEFRKQQQELLTQLKGINAQLDYLQGTTLDDMIKNNTEMINKRKEFNEMNKEQLDAWIADEKNANSQYMDLAKELRKSRFPEKSSKELDKEKKDRLRKEKEEANAVLRTEKDVIESLKELRDEDLANQEQNYNQQIYLLNQSLQEKKITQEQFDIMKLVLDRKNAEARLTIEKTYYSDAVSLQITHNELKEELVRASNERVVSAEKQANDKRISEQTKMNNLIKDFKDQFKVSTPFEDYEAQQTALKAAYQARKEALIKEHKDTLALDKAYYDASLKLQEEFENQKNAIKDKYGLRTLKEKYLEELSEIDIYLNEGLMTFEEYLQAKAKVSVDYYSNLVDTWTNTFSSLFQSLQDLEFANLDKQYDAQIEAAKGNSEEVSRLEEEKERKKLDIQKKYANVNFAIKVSQIIADTAVSIMKAYADLGPIAGAVAAALMSATGAVQVAAANAERQKVMSMSVSGSSYSTGSGTFTRVPGKEDGGYIGVTRQQDGKKFQAVYNPSARGFISRPTVIVGEGPAGMSREWVASNAAVMNPTVSPILSVIDQAQQAGTIRTLDLNKYIASMQLRGKQEGGKINTEVSVPSSNSNISPDLIRKLTDVLSSFDKNGIKAFVALSDIKAKEELRNKAIKKSSKVK